MISLYPQKFQFASDRTNPTWHESDKQNQSLPPKKNNNTSSLLKNQELDITEQGYLHPIVLLPVPFSDHRLEPEILDISKTNGRFCNAKS